jgi:hypothetical protein
MERRQFTREFKLEVAGAPSYSEAVIQPRAVNKLNRPGFVGGSNS